MTHAEARELLDTHAAGWADAAAPVLEIKRSTNPRHRVACLAALHFLNHHPEPPPKPKRKPKAKATKSEG